MEAAQSYHVAEGTSIHPILEEEWMLQGSHPWIHRKRKAPTNQALSLQLAKGGGFRPIWYLVSVPERSWLNISTPTEPANHGRLPLEGSSSDRGIFIL